MVSWLRSLYVSSYLSLQLLSNASKQPNGSKGVKVGTRIAVYAEPNDDLNTIEIPAEDHTSASAKTETPNPAGSQPTATETESQLGHSGSPAPSDDNGQPSRGTRGTLYFEYCRTNRAAVKYPLYPSVVQLLHQNGFSTEKVAQIPATGPNGRLLKGDVLAHLGLIESTYPRKQSDRLAKLSHLDLSQIDRSTARQPEPQIPQRQESVPLPAEPDTEIAVPISLAAVKEVQLKIHNALGIDIPLETFILRATEISNYNLPRSGLPPTPDELFNEVLGLEKAHSQPSVGAFQPQIIPLAPLSVPSAPTPKARHDIIDMLAGRPSKKQPALVHAPSASARSTSIKVFSVVVPRVEEKRGKIFLERMKTTLQVDPGRLVL